jgi:ribosomal protein S18 acetylase RimI-like enzyme
MSVVVLQRESEREQGLRPLDVLRDMDGIARLIDVAFAEDMAQDGAGVRNDLAILSATSPLLWVLRNVSSEMRDSLDGFVWTEDNHVVGNVTLARDAPERRVWTISNVAVHPDYRRRGIARALMEAVLERIEERGGGKAVLEVKANNKAAYDLYVKLGFQLVDGTVTARHPGRPTEPLPLAARARRLTPSDWRKLYDLALRTRSSLAERINPLREQDYAQTPIRRIADGLSDFWQQEQRFWLAVEKDGRLCGAVHLHLRRYGGNSASIVIAPDERNYVEEALVQATLLGGGVSGRAMTAQVASSEDVAQAVLWQHGFTEVRHLHRLMKEV